MPTRDHPSDRLVDSYQIADNTIENEDGEKVVDLGDGFYNLDKGKGYRNLSREEEEYLSQIFPVDPDKNGRLQVKMEDESLYLERNGERIDITDDPDFNFGYFFPEFEAIAGGSTRPPDEDDEAGIGTKAGVALLSLGLLGAGAAISQMDFDGDGLNNYEEWQGPSDYQDPDTSGDGIDDNTALQLGLDPTTQHEDISDILNHLDNVEPGTLNRKYLNLMMNSTEDVKSEVMEYGLHEDGVITEDELLRAKDPDGDYITTKRELEKWGTDPLKADTDGGGFNDFHEAYIYRTDPNDPADDREMMEKIPNLDTDPVSPTINKFSGLGMTEFTDKKVRDLATSDPLVKWFAERTEIENWRDVGENMEVGIIRYPEVGTGDGVTGGDWYPGHFLTNGADGWCAHYAWANASIFELKGYETERVSGWKGEGGHAWVEAYDPEDGEIYVLSRHVARNSVSREWLYDALNFQPDNDYDPDWFKEN